MEGARGREKVAWRKENEFERDDCLSVLSLPTFDSFSFWPYNPKWAQLPVTQEHVLIGRTLPFTHVD